MTKTEFTQKLARRHKLSLNEAERLLNAFLDSVEDGLFRDGRVEIRGFGAFIARGMAERRARNPHTGESMIRPAVKAVRFKPAAALIDILN